MLKINKLQSLAGNQISLSWFCCESSILDQLDFTSIGHSKGRITGIHVQWNPVNPVNNGPQKYGSVIKGAAI